MPKARGFTMVELMVVIAIIAVLLRLAVPSFRNQIVSANISSAVNTFMADMRFTRSEAVRRSSAVIMCRSDAPEASSPACGSGTGPGGLGWISGWIIFVDVDNSGTRTTGDIMLRVQAPLTSVDSALESGASSSTKFIFTALGRMKSLGSATSIQFGSNFAIPSNLQRVVCVNSTGRVRIAGDGLSSCGTTN